jgi:hypothetical protein
LDFEEDAGGVIEDAAGDAGGGGDAVDEGPEADALNLAANMPAVAKEGVGRRGRRAAGHEGIRLLKDDEAIVERWMGQGKPWIRRVWIRGVKEADTEFSERFEAQMLARHFDVYRA